ncbi:TetR/AcrR family transcriptional repressor of nem operon [Kineococcus radiotolerans]|uniref:TetR/AcrR family transcriptional repressor of nem operon n=1 Tax=Kineococcus radiotolerans TaxID=131568 RepID=A0A7W4TQP0_KINRA|nr:TetR/AcrR family transcriptional regulator [Kineococcus radiotolerans]MBB2903365.1 TetR/AcrR family transcriptional repressor of nem operon [Kineococcus radiotolerans]
MARTKEFEPAVVLTRATATFWAKGYEYASTQDLMTAMGVGKRSMYDTFGDKHELYLKALRDYIERAEQAQDAAITSAGGGLSAVRALLNSHVQLPADARQLAPTGCFAVNAASERGGSDAQVTDLVQRHFARCVVTIGHLLRQEPRWADAEAIAVHRAANAIHNAWIGLRVLARAGAGPGHMREGVDDLLAAFA